MSKKDIVKLKGFVNESFPGAKFKVTLENKHVLKCVLSGKIRTNNIHIAIGDQVDVELSPYDLSLGRIVYRY